MTQQKPRYGVLLINLGSPEALTKKAVKRYLKVFLGDRRVIEANRFLWPLILNGIILPFRSPKTLKSYQKIWFQSENESPLIYYTRRQSEWLEHHTSDDMVVTYAMRYGQPAIEDRMHYLMDQGIEELMILPLYPQYSATTTASIYDEIYRILGQYRWQPNLIEIAPYYDHPRYIEALTSTLAAHLNALGFTPDCILASFHGIPQVYVDKGDPYYTHCCETFRLLKARMDETNQAKMQMSFQSRFGPQQWLKPYTSDVLAECARQGYTKMVVLAPGFAADCLETLEELAEDEYHNFLNAGGEQFHLIPCLNDTQVHLNLLNTLVQDYKPVTYD